MQVLKASKAKSEMNNRKLFLTLLVTHWLLSVGPLLYGWISPKSPTELSSETWLDSMPVGFLLMIVGVWLFGGILVLFWLATGKRWALPCLAVYHCFFAIIVPLMDPFVVQTSNLFVALESLSYFLLGLAVAIYVLDRKSTQFDE